MHYKVLDMQDTNVLAGDPHVTTDGLSFVTADNKKCMIPHAQFVQEQYRLSEPPQLDPVTTIGTLFEIVPDDNNTVRINNVPIFSTYADVPQKRGSVDESYLDDMVKTFWSLKSASVDAFGDRFVWLPKVHVQHSSEDGPERPVVGFVDNLRRKGKVLYCDFRYLNSDFADALRSGTYPDRSIELDFKGRSLLSVALLGSSTPFFKLPQMRQFSNTTQHGDSPVQRYVVEDVVDRVDVVYEDNKMNVKEVASGLLHFFAAHNVKYTGTLDDMADFVETYAEKTGLDQIYELVRKMLLQKKTSEQNTQEPNKAYEVTPAELVRFVQSDGVPTTTAGTTESINPNYPKKKVGKPRSVASTGEPASAERHFDEDADVTRFVDDLPEDVRGPIRTVIERYNATLEKYGQAVDNLKKHVDEERQKRVEMETSAVRERYRGELVGLRASGSMAVRSEKQIDEHLNFIMDMKEDRREAYMDMLRSQPKVSERQRVSLSGARGQTLYDAHSGNGQNKIEKYKQDYKSDSKLRAGLRQLGIKSEEDVDRWSTVMAYADMEDNFKSEGLPGDGVEDVE